MRIRRNTARLPAALAGLLIAAMPGAAPAADEGTKAKQEIAEAYDAVADYSYAKKEDLVAWLEARRESLAKDAAALREKASDAGADAKENLGALSQRLEAQREAASKKLERLGNVSAEAWGDLKRRTLKAYETLENEYRDAMGGDDEA